jgi:hypothetical protein
MTSKRRIRQIYKRLDSIRHVDLGYSMKEEICERDLALIEMLEVYGEMKLAVANRMGLPPEDTSGGTPTPPPRDYALEVLGPRYTRKQFGQLASKIALERRSYPPPAVTLFVPRLAETLEDGLTDEYGQPFLDFTQDEVGSVD